MSSPIIRLDKEIVKELNGCIVVLDTETTGFSKYKDRIVEFGAIKLIQGKPVDTIEFLINPTFEIPQRVIDVHGITNEMVRGKPDETFYIPKLIEFIKDSSLLVGHNVSFDIGFLEEMFKRSGYGLNCSYLDTLKFAREIFPQSPNHKLTTLADYLNLPVSNAHRALSDVETTIHLLRHLAYQVNK